MRVFLSLVLLTVAATTGTTSALRHPLEHYEEKFRAWVKVRIGGIERREGGREEISVPGVHEAYLFEAGIFSRGRV